MIVHYPHMTGKELHRMQKLSGLTQDQLYPLLGLETRAALLHQFRKDKVDDEVAAAAENVPELSINKMMVSSKQNDVGQNGGGSEVIKILTDTLITLRDLVKDGRVQNQNITKALDKLSETNDHVREEAVLYRKMLADGYDAGLLQWNVKAKKQA